MKERIPRINQLIKKELSQIILKEIDFSQVGLATVTRVETSVDLNQAKVYISVIPENKKKMVLRILNWNIYDLQQALNKRLRMRPIPKIVFVEEKETKTAARVEELLEKINKADSK